MKKNGFTLVELLAVIVVLAITSGIVSYTVNHVIEKGKLGIYENYESTLKGSAETYLIENMDRGVMPNVGSSVTITLQTLTDGLYMEKIKDPKGGNCNSSYVLVTRGADISNNFNLDYKVCLICTYYKSDGC